jgi:hypothetical protein
MNLTARERLQFAEYARQESESYRATAEQMRKLGMGGMSEQLEKRHKYLAAAYATVAMDLSARREEYSVGSEDIGEVPE